MESFDIEKYKKDLRLTLENANKANLITTGRNLSSVRITEVTMRKMEVTMEEFNFDYGDSAALGLVSQQIMKEVFLECQFSGVGKDD